jgi:hypothetical protein
MQAKMEKKIPSWVVSSRRIFNASILKDGLCMAIPRRVVKPTCIRSELEYEDKFRGQVHEGHRLDPP